MQSDIFSFLALNIKALGTVFRKPGLSFDTREMGGQTIDIHSGTMARKVSIHRATTIGPKTPLYQVILKNTTATKEVPIVSSNPSINRSQSLLTTNSRIPVLAPARAERARLEAILADVWTRDVLPFPGITARSRSEHLVRASASSMMRKLSAVSIGGSFTRRSASLASLQQQQREKGGATEATATVSTTDAKRRTSDGGLPRVVPMVVQEDTSLVPVHSVFTDSGHGQDQNDTGELEGRVSTGADTDTNTDLGAGADELEIVIRPGPRCASAPDELGTDTKGEEYESREMIASTMCAAAEAVGVGSTAPSPRRNSRRSDLSETSEPSKEAKMEMKVIVERVQKSVRRGAEMIQGDGEKEGQRPGMGTGRALFRSRSLRLSRRKKLVSKETGVGRRGAVAEGIRSLFR